MSGLDTNREKRWTVRIGKSPKGKTKRISLCVITRIVMKKIRVKKKEGNGKREVVRRQNKE